MILLYIFLGFIILAKSADFFVQGASNLAKKLGISEFIIGLTIVAIGTSAPELLVNIKSALGGYTDLAISNILGSNIANIGLILGCIIITSNGLKFDKNIKQNLYISIIFTILLQLLGTQYVDNIKGIGTIGGIILLVAIIGYSIYIYQSSNDSLDQAPTAQNTKTHIDLLKILLGIIGLVLGGEIVVNNAILIAKTFGLSQKIIGLTIIAIGTSLPELVTSIVAVKKGNAGIAIGNIIGSNISNIGLILGITSLISPLNFYNSAYIDIIVIIFLTIITLIFANYKNNLTKVYGYILIGFYIIYILYSIFFT